MEVITRAEALKLGLKNYYTGEPCKHGHISERNVTGGYCIECKAITKKKYRIKNKENLNEKNREWKNNNRAKVNEDARKYKANNKEKIKAQRKHYLKNTDALEIKRSYNRKWRKKDWQRYHTDPLYRCNKICRNIIDRTIKASKKNKEAKTLDLLGYTANDLK